RDRLVREFFEARGVETTNPALGQSLYRGILDRHPGFAEAHFRLGRLLQHAGLIAEARRHFSEALEHDGLPNRCKLAFRAVYHYPGNKEGHIPTRSASEGPMKSS